jgi:hypothetical protein
MMLRTATTLVAFSAISAAAQDGLGARCESFNHLVYGAWDVTGQTGWNFRVGFNALEDGAEACYATLLNDGRKLEYSTARLEDMEEGDFVVVIMPDPGTEFRNVFLRDLTKDGFSSAIFDNLTLGRQKKYQ